MSRGGYQSLDSADSADNAQEHKAPRRAGRAYRLKKLHGVILFGLLLITTLGSTMLMSPAGTAKPGKKNIIFMVTDGMGPASLALTRGFKQHRDKSFINDILTLDKHLIGSSRTRSNDSVVTDSAAGATAFSCAMKTYNNAVGVDPSKNPCGTVLEALKLQGYLTGLVVTTRVTDATPAAFSSHVTWRTFEDLIAEHQLGHYPLGRSVDLMIGGGRAHFYSPADTAYGAGGARADGRNLISEAVESGWSYVSNRSEFDQLALGQNVELPLLALLTDNNIPFDIDRDDAEFPSLEEEALTALHALSRASADSDQGFFLLIEGSRIDHAGHNNDPAAQVREVLAYDKMFRSVLEFADQSDVETVVISTSDHETGGLATALQTSDEYPDYIWFPEVLLSAQHSGEYASAKLSSYKGGDFKKLVVEVLEMDLGIHDYTAEDVEYLCSNPAGAHFYLNRMISTRARIGWSTHGHSAVDVNIYAYSNKPETMDLIHSQLRGNRENTDMGEFIREYAGLDLDYVTGLLKGTQNEPSAGGELRGAALDPYHLPPHPPASPAI